MSNIITKIFIIIVAIISLIAIIPVNISKASELKGIVSNMSEEEAPPNNMGVENLKKIIKSILGAIRLLTGLATIIMIAYAGFKMVTGDTPKEKNDIKKAMIPIVTGTLIVFSATSIATFIIGVFE